MDQNQVPEFFYQRHGGYMTCQFIGMALYYKDVWGSYSSA